MARVIICFALVFFLDSSMESQTSTEQETGKAFDFSPLYDETCTKPLEKSKKSNTKQSSNVAKDLGFQTAAGMILSQQDLETLDLEKVQKELDLVKYAQTEMGKLRDALRDYKKSSEKTSTESIPASTASIPAPVVPNNIEPTLDDSDDSDELDSPLLGPADLTCTAWTYLFDGWYCNNELDHFFLYLNLITF
jgi:hypothetical protein